MQSGKRSSYTGQGPGCGGSGPEGAVRGGYVKSKGGDADSTKMVCVSGTVATEVRSEKQEHLGGTVC